MHHAQVKATNAAVLTNTGRKWVPQLVNKCRLYYTSTPTIGWQQALCCHIALVKHSADMPLGLPALPLPVACHAISLARQAYLVGVHVVNHFVARAYSLPQFISALVLHVGLLFAA